MKVKGIVTLICIVLCSFETAWSQVGTQKVHKWYVPDLLVGQFAGSIGLISAGAGYDILRGHGHLEGIVGYVPAFVGSDPLETITLKFTAMPWKADLNKNVRIFPLTMGAYFCYTPGRQFSSDLPAWYPDAYYWWSEAVRANLFLGSSVRFAADRLKTGSHLTFYYEVGTNEIKLVSYVQNRSALDFWSVLHAGIGVRYHFSKQNTRPEKYRGRPPR